MTHANADELTAIVEEAKAVMTPDDWTALINGDWTESGIEQGILGDWADAYTAKEVLEAAQSIG